MKRIIVSVLALLTVTLMLVPSVSASGKSTGPDWLVTELCADTKGFSAKQSGYTTGSDGGEFIELYNNSDRTLNLYDYCIIYNGNEPSSGYYHKQIAEITPIKAGDYRDGSTITQLMTNPSTCSVAPGECVVLWVIFADAVNNGVSEAEFRAHWGISSDVKVIAFDGNSAVDKNFNVKNSGVGTYGIALYNSTLKSKKDSTIDTGGYDSYAAIISYATFDYGVTGSSAANYTASFTAPQTNTKEMTYQSYNDYSSTTPGYLNEGQLMSLNSTASWVQDLYAAGENTAAQLAENTTQSTDNANQSTGTDAETDDNSGCGGVALTPMLLLFGAALLPTLKKRG